jgi:hypothetical protein
MQVYPIIVKTGKDMQPIFGILPAADRKRGIRAFFPAFRLSYML